MTRTHQTNRRTFLKVAGQTALGTAAGLTLQSTRKAHAGVSANDKINLGVIGLGGMGNSHLNSLLKRQDINIVAVCDVYKPRYEAALAQIDGDCRGYQDFRHILDRNDVDAILSATPDHWHALMTIMGCQAGKDVYIEKPLSTTIEEGRKMVEAARRYNRVVQVGIQQRSMPVFKHAIEVLRQGTIGEIVGTEAWVGQNQSALLETPKAPPEGLDWDLWLGPAPWVPCSPERFYGFRAFDDYAGGELTNWGPHLVDIALWGMQEDQPLAVSAVANSLNSRLPGSDQQYLKVIYDFPGCQMTWTQNSPHYQIAGKGFGTCFQGTAGRLVIDRASCVVEPQGLGIPEFKSQGDFFIELHDHHDDFFECIRTRRKPVADVEIAHRATTACLLGNIAVDCRRRLEWDGVREQFVNDPQADRHLFRPYRAPWHL